MSPLFSESIEDVGDLVLDLGEAYYDIGMLFYYHRRELLLELSKQIQKLKSN